MIESIVFSFQDVLQKYQDASLQRKAELREQIKREQQAKQQLELTYRADIQSRDQQIEQLKKDQEENHKLQDKVRERNSPLSQTVLLNLILLQIAKLETVLLRSKEAIQTHQEKQAEFIIQNSALQQQLTEKQTMIRVF